jgi:hypothetical protein
LAAHLERLSNLLDVTSGSHTKYGDNWALVPIMLVFISVIAAHVWLLLEGGWSVGLIAYGLLHIAFVLALSFWPLTLISKDSI